MLEDRLAASYPASQRRCSRSSTRSSWRFLDFDLGRHVGALFFSRGMSLRIVTTDPMMMTSFVIFWLALPLCSRATCLVDFSFRTGLEARANCDCQGSMARLMILTRCPLQMRSCQRSHHALASSCPNSFSDVYSSNG